MIEEDNEFKKDGLFASELEKRIALQPYECALALVHTMLENLNSEYSNTFGTTPIQNIESRIKKPDSIEQKLIKYGCRPTAYNLNRIYDIAGIRSVCCCIDDVYNVAEYLTTREDIRLLKESDYIKNPKPNGYRSLHLVLEIKVPTLKGVRLVPVEVQLRTSAMNFWASIEHQMIYKSKEIVSVETREQMRIYAETVNQMDVYFGELRASQGDSCWEKIYCTENFEAMLKAGRQDR